MKIDIQPVSREKPADTRVTLVPSSEQGLFIIDQHNVVPGEFDGAVVRRIGLFGLGDPAIEQIQAGDVDLHDVLQQDPRSATIVPSFESVSLLAEVEPGFTSTDGVWRAIASFKEFEPVVNATA